MVRFDLAQRSSLCVRGRAAVQAAARSRRRRFRVPSCRRPRAGRRSGRIVEVETGRGLIALREMGGQSTNAALPPWLSRRPRPVAAERGGPGRNRTGIQGFAVLCITTLPPDHARAARGLLAGRGPPVKPGAAPCPPRHAPCLARQPCRLYIGAMNAGPNREMSP